MKRFTALIAALALALVPAAAFADGEDIRIYLDGKLVELTDANGNPVTPIIIDGTTYLPVRAISSAMDLTVVWSDAARSIYLSSDGNEVVAEEVTVFSTLERYLNNPYGLLGTSAFLTPLKNVLGSDYDALVATLDTVYASGDGDMLTLRSAKSVIDVYGDGRIDAALLSPKDSGFGGANVIKYYSSASPDAIDSAGVLDFISKSVSAGYETIDFVGGKGAPSSVKGTYTDIYGYGSFTFTEDGDRLLFKGSIKNSPNGSCSTSGEIYLSHGCTVCTENGAPSILFAFSGTSLTVVGLDNVTKALTTVYEK